MDKEQGKSPTNNIYNYNKNQLNGYALIFNINFAFSSDAVTVCSAVRQLVAIILDFRFQLNLFSLIIFNFILQHIVSKI